MISAERIKQQIIRAIKVNPTEIEIKQVIKVIVDGHLEKQDSIKNLNVLIYPYKNNEVQISSSTIGTSYSNKKYSMMADYTADLNVNSKEAIKFDCKEGNMKIKAVYPVVIKEIICGYECDLERID